MRQGLQGGADEGAGSRSSIDEAGRPRPFRVPGRHGRDAMKVGRPDAVGHAQRGHEGGISGCPAFEVLAVVGDSEASWTQLDRVGEVAVVGQRGCPWGGASGAVPHASRRSSRSADVAESDVAAQLLEGLLGEHLRDEAALILYNMICLPFSGVANTGALLPRCCRA